MSFVSKINVVQAPAQKVAQPARAKRRHALMVVSFLVCVLVPMLVASFYLYRIAQDQYASEVGFYVQKEDVSASIDVISGLSNLSGSSSSDTDILYRFIGGQQMVITVDDTLDLERIYSRPNDPVFSLPEKPSLEDMEAYWKRVVDIFYDPGSGLIEVRVVAFAANDAQDIAEVILQESTRMINELSRIAREDSMSYAKAELAHAVEQLKIARTAITAFRSRTKVVDPRTDIEGRIGLLNDLQSQLANTLIELDLLELSSQGNGPRITQARRRVEVIRARILKEKDRFGENTIADDGGFSNLYGQYEALNLELEFAQESYLSALANHNAAIAESQRKSRYLAAYKAPTRASSPQYPKRGTHLLLIGSILCLSWVITILIYYSVRDRR